MQDETKDEVDRKLLEPGDMFGDYTVEKLLGKGGMGAVYLVRAPGGERYAVKLMFPEMVKKGSDYRKRFAREAEFAMKIRHKNLISVYDVGEDPDTGLCYIIMDYVPGGSVADRLEHGGPLPMAEAVSIAAQVALALEVAHRHGVIHRDIKPENIMFDADGTPKLADLGVAKFTDEAHKTTVTTTGMIIGTPAYMAPEQMMDSHHIDARADIYALGIVLYEMLTGKRPNEGSTAVELLAKAIKGEPLPDVRTMRPEISAAVAHVLSLMCAPKPEDRPTTSLAAAELLQKAATGRLALPKKPPRAAEAQKAKRRFPVLAAAVSIVLVSALAIYGIVCHSGRDKAMPGENKTGKAAAIENPTAGSYVQDGLVAMWDGIENAGSGRHDPVAKVWKNLVAGQDAEQAGSLLVEWSDNSAIFGSKRYFRVNTLFENPQQVTVEVCHRAVPAKGSGYSALFSSCQFGGIGFQGDGNSKWIVAVGNPAGGYYSQFRMPVLCDKAETLAFTVGDVLTAYRDAKVFGMTSGIHGIRYNNKHVFQIGRDPGDNGDIAGEIHSIRLYSRPLSADEIRRNHEIDRVRFDLDRVGAPKSVSAVAENAGAVIEWRDGPSDAWFVEWDKALAEARKTGKRLFVLNTGSDWCSWCMKLRADVLNKPEFNEFAKQNLVLLYLDSPNRDPLCKEQKTHNREIVKALGLGGGVPNAGIFSADGKYLGGIRGGGQTVDVYIDRIKNVLKAGKTEPIRGDDGKMLFDVGYGKLAARRAEERAKLSHVSKDDFKARLTGVAVCDRKNRKFDDLEFLSPTTHLDVATGKMAVFRVEHDFPTGYAAAVWVLGRGRLFSNPSGRYPGKGVKYGFLGLHEARQDVRLDSIDIRTNSEPELDDYPRGWLICSPQVDIVFFAQGDGGSADDRAVVNLPAGNRVAERKTDGFKPANAKQSVLIPRLARDPRAWAYSFEKEQGWEKADFDDSGWRRAPGGFGLRHNMGQLQRACINTEWNSERIFLRRRFDWSGGKVSRAVVDAYHDDDVDVYLNGMLVLTIRGSNTDWQPFEVNAERFANAIRKGENVFCVEVRNNRACQYFDCGLVVECGGTFDRLQRKDGTRTVKTKAGTWTVVVKDGVAQIGDGRNVALDPEPRGSLTIPSELDGMPIRKLASRCFHRCQEIEGVVIPENVRSIGPAAFFNCNRLSEVSLPESLEHIGWEAFHGTELKRVDLKNVRLLEGSVFKFCKMLDGVDVNPGNITFKVRDGVLYDKARRSVAFCPRSKESYAFPAGVEDVYDSAFTQCNIKSIEIPKTVKGVWDCAFEACPRLESVKFAGDNVSFGGWAFGNNPALRSIDLPCGQKSLDAWAIFNGCELLESITLPDTVEIIGKGVFERCPRLKKVYLGKSLSTIKLRTFATCPQLEEVNFPKTLKELGAEAFLKCESLQRVTFAGNAPSLRNDGNHLGRNIYKGANASLVTIVPQGSTGWKNGSDKLPKAWPVDGGESARPIRNAK